MSPRRILGEMRGLGITATELGALGWLPTDPVELHDLLGEFGLRVLGGFVPLVLHGPASHGEVVQAIRDAANTLRAAGAEYFVSAVVSSFEAWERPAVDDAAWASIMRNLDVVEEVAGEYGLTQVVHPHVNTLIETREEFERFLADSSVRFCLDTGHLFVGGADPVAIAREHVSRVGVVHIKDVNPAIAARLTAGELTLMGATQLGLFPSAGQGAVPIADTVRTLERAGYGGWYVLEQDVALTEGEPPLGEGPVLAVKESIQYLQELAA